MILQWKTSMCSSPERRLQLLHQYQELPSMFSRDTDRPKGYRVCAMFECMRQQLC